MAELLQRAARRKRAPTGTSCREQPGIFFTRSIMHKKLFLFTALLCSSFSQEDETIAVLHTDDVCGNFSIAQVCVGPSAFTGLNHQYKSMTIWVEDDSDLRIPGIKKNQRKASLNIEMGFEFRTEGKTLFFLTDLLGPTIPAHNTIEESPFFCLTDSIGTVRGLKGIGASSIQSKLVQKAFSQTDSLYTYELLHHTSFDSPHLAKLVLNNRLEVKQLIMDTRGFYVSTGKNRCDSTPFLIYK